MARAALGKIGFEAYMSWQGQHFVNLQVCISLQVEDLCSCVLVHLCVLHCSRVSAALLSGVRMSCSFTCLRVLSYACVLCSLSCGHASYSALPTVCLFACFGTVCASDVYVSFW